MERRPFKEPPPVTTVPLRLSFYLNAFWILSTERQVGMAMGAIPWRAIKEYGEYYNLNPNQMDFLFEAIHQMDAKWLKANADEQNTKGKSSG